MAKPLTLTFLLAVLMMSAVGCSQSLAAADSKLAAQKQDTTNLQKVRIVSVRQHEDRMPIATDDGRAMPPRVITVVTFETDACVDASNHDFQLSIDRKARAALAKIETDGSSCSENARAHFEVVTNQLRVGESLVVINPVLVDLMAATE